MMFSKEPIMSVQKKQPISKKASQSQARRAGVKVQTSVKAGNGIGTRTGDGHYFRHH
jgi:hypothetical protein